MSKRVAFGLATLALIVALLGVGALGGCGQRTVSVQTGERVVCSYGEEVSSTVRTIRVPAKDAGKYSVTTKEVTCDKHTQLETLYSEAQTAIGKQDFKTAQAKLAEVVKLDATYESAATQLSAIKNGEKPAPDTASGGSSSTGTTGTAQPDSNDTTKPADTAKPEGPVASLLVYTPDSIAGYKAKAVGSDVFSVSRQYLPISAGKVASLSIFAEQQRTAQAAKSWLQANVKTPYSTSARNVRIAGRDAYLGTDGKRFAVIGWTNGPITVVIEADAGNRPADAYAALQAVASKLPK